MLNAIATGLGRLPAHPDGSRASVEGSNNIGTKPIPRPARCPASTLDPRRASAPGLRLHLHRGRWSASAIWFAAQPHPLRLRPAGHRAAPSRPPWPAGSTSSDGRHRDAAVRRGGRPGRHAAAARRVLHLQPDFPAGLGFTGIAIALLGRNNPVGIAFAALLWAFLDTSPQHPADFDGHPHGDRRRSCRARSCCRSSSPTSSSAATASRGSGQRRVGSATRRAADPTPARRRRRHERTAVRPWPDAATPVRGAAGAPSAGSSSPGRSCCCVLGVLIARAALARPRRHRRRRPHLGRDDRRGASRWPCRSGWPVSAACGPSAPAWSTSASRA